MKKILLIFSLFGLLISSYGQLQVPAVASSGQSAAGGGAPYTDNFDSRNTAALGGQGLWLDSFGNILVVDDGGDNVVQGDTSVFSCATYDATLNDDQYSQVVVQSTNGSSDLATVNVRLNGSNSSLDGYAYCFRSGTSRIYRIDDGVWTGIDNWDFTTTFSVGDIVRLQISGTTLTVYVNGSINTNVATGGSTTDANYSLGKAGIGFTGNNATLTNDSWEGGNL